MTVARSYLVDDENSGCYHLISRCVRCAFLCGDRYEHRREWIQRRIQDLNQLFAVDILAFAVMSNHLHLAVKNRPKQADRWTPREVAERWLRLFPRSEDESGGPCLPPDFIIDGLANDITWVETRRKRLSSLSWFMKCLKEPIARRANAEDGCKGTFWESRFQSVKLLDQAALIACMAYIDLNPVRAQMAVSPEDSDYTSIQLRMNEWRDRQHALKNDFLQTQKRHEIVAEHQWLTSLTDCLVGDDGDCGRSTPLTLQEYISIVDQTGRFLHSRKRGQIDSRLAPVFERLKITPQSWHHTMLSSAQFTGTAIGNALARTHEASKRGLRCLFNRCKLYHDGTAPS